ncbi:small acidic protein-like [Liolophura sinensis]|uniref:small acidic protein-like n=1 Tax=Liolophura sinensis TaxID=3198878 RepID=UPI00315922BC
MSKTFVTSDGAKHTRFPSDDEEDQKQKKRPEKTIEKIEVHSANSWEKADLGDGERNNKFLRLMGAGKKKHQGRFVIGDNTPHGSTVDGLEKKLDDKLEEQYKHSMEHRLLAGPKGHVGLGFHDEAADSKGDDQNGTKNSDAQTTNTKDKDSGEDTKKESKHEKSEYLKRPAEKSSETKEDKSDAKKMKFVKSSDD